MSTQSACIEKTPQESSIRFSIDGDVNIIQLFKKAGIDLSIQVKEHVRNGGFTAQVPGLSWEAETSAGFKRTGNYLVTPVATRAEANQTCEKLLKTPYTFAKMECGALGIKSVTLVYSPSAG